MPKRRIREAVAVSVGAASSAVAGGVTDVLRPPDAGGARDPLTFPNRAPGQSPGWPGLSRLRTRTERFR